MIIDPNKVTIASQDTPSVDYIVPKWDFIERVLKDNSPANLVKAETHFDKLLALQPAGKGPGDKYSLNKDIFERCKEHAVEIGAIIEKHGLPIISVGGTGANKLYAASNLTSNTNILLIGAVGNDAPGALIRNKFQKDGIFLYDNGEALPHTRECIIVTPKGAKNRMAAKGPYTPPEFYRDVNKINDIATRAGLYFLESSPISFFSKGKDDFISHSNLMKEAGVNIIYSPPTDLKFYVDDNIKGFRTAAKNSAVVTLNETEAIWYTLNKDFKDKVSGREDENLQRALDRIQKTLNKKYYSTSSKTLEQVVLVTAGEHGMIALAPNGTRKEQDAHKVENIINTIGAGDATASVFAVSLLLNKENIERAMEKANNVGAAVIQQQPAQIERGSFLAALEGKVPTSGKVSYLQPPLNSREMER